MGTKSMDLVWITVKDFKKAIKFYTEVVGLTLLEENETFGWAELAGPKGGARVGIAKMPPEGDTSCGCTHPGQNAVMTFTVDNIEESIKEFKNKGATLIGDVIEVPGQVKMQTMQDEDHNQFQLVEVCHSCHCC